MNNSDEMCNMMLGIVTVLYNSEDVLSGFFESLAVQSKCVNFCVYIIDNSETDYGSRFSQELATKFNIKAVIKFNNENVGVARANNQGIKLAIEDGCQKILLANNDTEFGPTTIELLMSELIINDEKIVTPKIMYFGDSKKIWYGGGYINSWTMRTPHYGIDQIDQGQFDQPKYVYYAPTCFMMIDCQIFNMVGLMDEKYFVYYDDTDFVWRVINNRIKIKYIPKAIVLHKVSSSTGGSFSSFSLYFTNRNRIYFILKNLRGFKKFFSLSYCLITRLLYFFKLPKDKIFICLKAIRDGYTLANSSIEKKNEI
jgi:GT2 family glycosyltransferase